MNKDSLRHVATLAKERMKNGYWKESREQPCARCETNAPAAVFVTRDAAGESEFRAKVKAILESDAQVSNAIWLLLDTQEYENADYTQKQKMVLETSARYRRVREELERQRNM